MDTTEFHIELDRRLDILSDPTYEDPARADLPARDLIILLCAGLLISAVLMVWGYPW